jgi:hypothetical protein
VVDDPPTWLHEVMPDGSGKTHEQDIREKMTFDLDEPESGWLGMLRRERR